MKVDALIRWFMPKEERFHDLLARDTANLLRAARLFSEFAHTPDLEVRRVRITELKDLEHEGDRVTRQVFEALYSTFLTPLDREDIRSIAIDLDDILDYLEGVARNLVLFELAESPEGLRQFSQILVEMIEEIERLTALIWDLGNGPRIHASIVRISELENRADSLYNSLIAQLFGGNGRDPIEILKWKEIYEGLENACDQCKDFTYIIGNVVLKSS